MRGHPRPVDRDMLELMVAYGLLPGGTVGTDAPLPPAWAPAGPPAVLGVTGASAYVGQTTVVIGLALAWATRGRRVLLVDLEPSEELARLLQVGASIFSGTGHSLLHALRDGHPAEPMGTLLPEVDIIVSGGIATLEADALPDEMRREPDALRKAIGALMPRYDRVLVDCPPAPGVLGRQVAELADGMITVVGASPTLGDRPPSPGPFLGAVVTRWRPDTSPAPGWLATVTAPGSPWFQTVLPEIPGLRDAWDLVSGTLGGTVDAIFARLATEVDARLASARAPDAS